MTSPLHLSATTPARFSSRQDYHNRISQAWHLFGRLNDQVSYHDAFHTSPATPLPQIEPLRLSTARKPTSPHHLNPSSTTATTTTTSSSYDEKAPEGTKQTRLYLAYGSNLCDATFLGARGIRPLAQINVVVPCLRMTFDLPGVPYTEPCFANSAWRLPDDGIGEVVEGGEEGQCEKKISREEGKEYHKLRWHKGLVGTVYEVSLPDYAHIIATEGPVYADVQVPCYVLPPGSQTVPADPTSEPFYAHTLLAPTADDGIDHYQTRSRKSIPRPDPNYAQPSARYLGLITTGGIERGLPTEYQSYLSQLRSYTITSRRQAIARAMILAIWWPVIKMLMQLGTKLRDREGKRAERARRLLEWLFGLLMLVMWGLYDGVWMRVFGDGERTEGVGEDVSEEWARNRFC